MKMTIFKALKKIDSLTKEQLKHCIQRMDIEIEQYHYCIKNDSTDKLIHYGIPYLKKLNEQRQKFVDGLERIIMTENETIQTNILKVISEHNLPTAIKELIVELKNFDEFKIRKNIIYLVADRKLKLTTDWKLFPTIDEKA